MVCALFFVALAVAPPAGSADSSPEPWEVLEVDVAAGVVKARGERRVMKRVPKTTFREERRQVERDGELVTEVRRVPRQTTESVSATVAFETQWKSGPNAWAMIDGKRVEAKTALSRLKPGDHVIGSTAELGAKWRAVLRPGCVVLISTAAPPPVNGEPRAEEKDLLAGVNAARKEAMLPPLRLDATLLKAARAHAAEMARRRELNHVFDDKGPQERLAELKHDSSVVGENVAQGPRTPAETIDMWMNSTEHKDNILKPSFARLGAAVAVDDDGVRYWTLVFSGPPD